MNKLRKTRTKRSRRANGGRRRQSTRRRGRRFTGGKKDAAASAPAGCPIHPSGEPDCGKCMEIKFRPGPVRPTRDIGIYRLAVVNTGEQLPHFVKSEYYPTNEDAAKMGIVPKTDLNGTEILRINPAFNRRSIDDFFSRPFKNNLRTYRLLPQYVTFTSQQDKSMLPPAAAAK